jgi:hypothetical protein
MKKIVVLTKIQLSKYINDMYENEYLFFQPLKAFRSTLTDKTGRLDPKELNTKNLQINNLTITHNNKEIELHKILKNFNGQLTEQLNNPGINCCSMNWMDLEYGKLNSSLDEKLIEFGDKVLLITDCDKFMEILDKSIENLNYQSKRGRVTYYSPKIMNGDITFHHKDEKYKYQNEYRILISPTNDQSVNIPLPGLKKISTIINSEDLNKLIIR